VSSKRELAPVYVGTVKLSIWGHVKEIISRRRRCSFSVWVFAFPKESSRLLICWILRRVSHVDMMRLEGISLVLIELRDRLRSDVLVLGSQLMRDW
jgi:hypothetical protein